MAFRKVLRWRFFVQLINHRYFNAPPKQQSFSRRCLSPAIKNRAILAIRIGRRDGCMI